LVTGLAGFYKETPASSKLFLRWISPGDAFGLAALQTQLQPYLTTVIVLRAASVFVWERVSANALVSQVPRLRENAYAVANDYLARLADVLVVRARQTAQQRLARVLVESVRQIGHAGRHGTELSLTNERLAEMADVSMFTVSRQLSEWQSQGVLAKSRGKIVLYTPERLLSGLPRH
jgi:CRP-like cAMP-binding protein